MPHITNEEAVHMMDFTTLYIDPLPDPTVSQYRLTTFFGIFIRCWYSWPFSTHQQPWWYLRDSHEPTAGEPRFEKGVYTRMEMTEAGRRALGKVDRLRMFEALEGFVRANGLVLEAELEVDGRERVRLFVRNVLGTLPGQWSAGEEIIVAPAVVCHTGSHGC